MESVESSLPIQSSHPASDPVAVWYRLALLWTGDPSAAAQILREIFAVAPDELAQLRSKERRNVWIIRQIRSRTLHLLQENPAVPVDSTSLPSRVAALPEPSRSVFALFQCVDCCVRGLAETLGIDDAAFARSLASARQELSAGVAFPEKGLLRVHRPWGGDSSKVAKAARAAEAVPEFAAQIHADLQWREEIGRIALPEELASLNMAALPKVDLRAMVFHPAVLAIALAFLVVVGVVVYLAQTKMGDFPGKETVVALVEEEAASNAPVFEEMPPTEAGKLDDWFVLRGFEGYAVPRKLEKARVIGGRVFKHDGVLMAEVAFEKQDARMLVFRAADLKKGIEEGRRRIFQQDEWAVAAWTERANSYVVMFPGDSDEMPGFLRKLRGGGEAEKF